MAAKKKPVKKLGKKALKQTKGGLNFTTPIASIGEKPLTQMYKNESNTLSGPLT